MSRDPALDAFPRLSHPSSKIRLQAAEVLLSYFCRLHQKEDNDDEVATLGRRLVRGLASSRDAARRGYYLTFTGFLKVFTALPYSAISDLAEKELKVSTATTKGEEGDLCLGRIFFYGALIRSDQLQKASKKEQTEVLEGLLGAASKKSYLPSMAAPFLVHLLQISSEEQFTKVLWPVLKTSLAKEWAQQTQHNLFLLLHIYKKFKGVKKTELRGLLGPNLISKPNWPQLARLVLERSHPSGPLLALHLPPSEAVDFWTGHVQETLNKSSRPRDMTALDLLKGFIEAAEDNTLSGLLTHSVVALLKKSLQDKELRPKAGDAMEALVNKVKTAPDSTRAKVLEALTAEDFSFDQVTKCGLVRAVAGALQAEGLGLVVQMCTKVVSDDQKKNKDKTGALQMIATLATSTAATPEVRQEGTVFLLEQAFFSGSATGVLNQAAKSSFNRCLKNAPVVVLKGVVDHVDKQIQNSKKPLKMDKVAISAWKKMAAQVARLGKSEGKVEGVLAQLVIHLGLQLLTEPTSAIEALDELHECCDRILGGKQDKHWAEVVVELLLSLLANPSFALRVTVRKVFTALCPMITQQALDSLVEACGAQDNPLVPKDLADIDDDDSENESGEEESVEEEEEGSEEEDEESEEEEEENEDDEMEDLEDTAADKIRAAVRSALGTGAEVSDTESIDVDDISEEEGQRLDEALSQAFKGIRKGLSKKESLEQQQVVHFRLRVLDLVEAYVSSEHSLRLTLNLAGPLLNLLERSLRDQPLRPLEGRLRNIMASFGSLRRFKDTSGVTEKDLAECLSAILDHGQRTQAVFLAVTSEAAAVAAFLSRAAQTIKSTGALTAAFGEAIREFLCKRDCVLPAAFFTPLLKTAWPGNLELWHLLTEAAFSEDDKIRSFRRPQALSFLQDLVTNHQLRTCHASRVSELMSQMVDKAALALSAESLTQRFERQLLTMLTQVASKLEASQKETLSTALQAHGSKVVNSGRETKRTFKKLSKIFKFPFNDTLKEKPEEKEEPVEAEAEKVVVNGHASNGKKQKKNQKKKQKKLAKKRNAKEEKIAKKAAKRMRLEAASEGLDAVSFANVEMNNIED